MRPLIPLSDVGTIQLEKEGGVVTEQTYYVRVTALPTLMLKPGAVPAVLNQDYSLTAFQLGFALLIFPPHLQSLPLQLNLLAPLREENLVEFKLDLEPVEGAPEYNSPMELFNRTVVSIEGVYTPRVNLRRGIG